MRSIGEYSASSAFHICPAEICDGPQWPRAWDNGIVIRDRLVWGPSAEDPATHARWRIRYWSERDALYRKFSGRRARPQTKADLLPQQWKDRVDSLAAAVPIVVWTSPDHLLEPWWALHVVQTVVSPERPLLIAALGPDWRSLLQPEWIESTLRTLTADDESLLGGASAMWQAFTSSKSGEFFEACRKLGSAFCGIEVLEELYGAFVERRFKVGSHRVRLSVLDEALFHSLSVDTWFTPRDLCRRIELTKTLKHHVLSHDILFRLLQWHAHYEADDRKPLVMESCSGQNELTGSRHRLTPYGAELLSAGLSSADMAPAMWFGGVDAYGGGSVNENERGA